MEEKSKLETFLESRYFVAILVVLVAITAYCLGRLSKIEQAREPVRVLNSGQSAATISSQKAGQARLPTTEAVGNGGQVVASKSGTKYHYPWCPGAKQISEKNKITFNSIEEARSKGYTPAGNCKGLK